MNKLNEILLKIPDLISSKVSIIIYVLLFLYLFVFALFCTIIPFMEDLLPSNNVQLILGNYTNVLSALGASIAAGSGVATHRRMKKMHENNQTLQDTVDSLHKKINEISENNNNQNQSKIK